MVLTDEKKKGESYITYEKLGANKTRVTFDFYLKNNFVLLTMFRLFMKTKYEKAIQESMENLAEFVKEVKLPVEV